jgi:hypothetical protein
MPSFKTLIWECFGRLRKFHYLSMLIRAKFSRNYPKDSKSSRNWRTPCCSQAAIVQGVEPLVHPGKEANPHAFLRRNQGLVSTLREGDGSIMTQRLQTAKPS